MKASVEKELLSRLDGLKEKLEAIDKSNKKFLMAVTLNDGRTERLESRIADLKGGIISLLDNIDLLISAIDTCQDEAVKKGIGAFSRKFAEIAGSVGIKEIAIHEGEFLNPELHECEETVTVPEAEDGVIVECCMRGYIDLETGNVLRYAKVKVNKK